MIDVQGFPDIFCLGYHCFLGFLMGRESSPQLWYIVESRAIHPYIEIYFLIYYVAYPLPSNIIWAFGLNSNTFLPLVP